VLTLAQCAAFARITSDEMLSGSPLCPKHYWLLSSYLLNLDKGPALVRDMIVADFRAFLDLGALQRAADLLMVLRCFLSDYPEARYISDEHES
jgi:hypothetical protein